MIKFKTFEPKVEFVGTHNNRYSAADVLNQWLKTHPEVEVINWQACAVKTSEGDELHITIQYWDKEN